MIKRMIPPPVGRFLQHMLLAPEHGMDVELEEINTQDGWRIACRCGGHTEPMTTDELRMTADIMGDALRLNPALDAGGLDEFIDAMRTVARFQDERLADLRKKH
jgi:hypothetical protein